MFDTAAISKTFFRTPNINLLRDNGCQAYISRFTGEPYKLVLNGAENAKEPRLTITKSPKGYWVIKAEVSIGDWMFNSNLFLPNENDMKQFFPMLSDFVRFKTGIKFEAHRERVTRADPTRDFTIGEANVLRVIKELNNIEIPKYDRKPINFTGVYFKNKGQVKNKVYSIYSKHHELANKNASNTEIELAKGLLRFSIEHKNNRAVANIAKSLKLPNHNANQILTRQVSDRLLEDGMQLLNLQPLLDHTHSPLETLGKNFNLSKPLTLAGHLYYKQVFGSNYDELDFINLKPETIKKYDRECAKAGILSLE